MGVLSRHMQSPYQLYWTVACRILQYLKGAPGKGLFYRPSSHLDIVVYSDTVWVDDPVDHRSTTAYCTFVGDNLLTGD